MADPTDDSYLNKIGDEARQFQRNVLADVYVQKINAVLAEEYLNKAIQVFGIGTVDPIGIDVGALMVTALQTVADNTTNTTDLSDATRLLIVAAWRTVRALQQHLDKTVNPGPDTETLI